MCQLKPFGCNCNFNYCNNCAAAKVLSATHDVQVVGFSAASPSKPALHSVTRFVVVVPAVLVCAGAHVGARRGARRSRGGCGDWETLGRRIR